MTDEWSESEYRESVRDIAQEVWEACDAECESVEGSRELEERIDGTRWVIYYAGGLAVLRYSRNDSAVFDEMGDDAFAGCTHMGEVYTKAAYYAMRQDVLEELQDGSWPDPERTYTAELHWTLSIQSDDPDEEPEEEEETDEEEHNTLREAREWLKTREAEVLALGNERQHVEITLRRIQDSELDDHEVEE